MKKIFLTIAFALAFVFQGGAQQLQELPGDPEVRKGKLDNGLTYYIRHNDKPEQRADFYLATNVGAIQEAPDQDGLAHFLEHMCFNGTKNFPGKGILNYLESIGASFGGNVNASTGVEETIYMLNNIPLMNDEVVDNCILIMHDYSHFVTNAPEEIDKERGVIIEERRSRRTASWRMHEKSLPYYYGDSKYGSCTLIGSQENLESFAPESLWNFYSKWYNPDMQALIVVGDIDVDSVEQKIRDIFADIPAPETPTVKDVIAIPHNDEPVIGIITDPEATNTILEMLWKSDPTPEEMNNTVQGYLVDVLKSIIGTVMTERLDDICARPDTPFVQAMFGIGELCETAEVVEGTAVAREGEALSTLKAYLMEIEKMKRFGFSDAEVERAKSELLSQAEMAANMADTRKNSDFISSLIYNFFDNEPYMAPADELQLMQMLLPQLSSQVVNMVVAQMITPDNFVLVYKAPEKEGLVHPTEAEFRAVIDEVANMEIEANEEEETASEFLDPSKLKGAKVKKASTAIYGATQWILKNGVKVLLYPTEYEKDRITFSFFKNGGNSLIPTEDLPSFEPNISTFFTRNSGVSGFTHTQMMKMLAGKQLSVTPSISELRNGITGTSTVKDLETALQIFYLYFTDPRFDPDEYNQGIKTLEAVLPNYVDQPDYRLQEELYKALYNGNPRQILISEDILKKADVSVYERNYRKLFKDAAGATMIIVGDFDLETIRPLVEKYVGSLPKGKKALNWIDNDNDVNRNAVLADFAVDMQTPMTTVAQFYRVDEEYSYEKDVTYDALNYILSMIYTETLREDEGGTYGASTSPTLEREPKQFGMIQVIFETNPTSADKLRELAKDAIRKIAADGPSEEHYDKTVKNLEKNIPESRINNRYWVNALTKWVLYGDDYDTSYEAAVKALTPEKVQALAAEFLEKGNLIEIVMRPDKTAERE